MNPGYSDRPGGRSRTMNQKREGYPGVSKLTFQFSLFGQKKRPLLDARNWPFSCFLCYKVKMNPRRIRVQESLRDPNSNPLRKTVAREGKMWDFWSFSAILSPRAILTVNVIHVNTHRSMRKGVIFRRAGEGPAIFCPWL